MTKPLRVLHILQRMEAGGSQALLMNLYRKMDREKVQFDFLVEYPEKQFYDDEIAAMGGKIFYTSVREDLNIIKFMKYLGALFDEHPEYRIVHMHTYSIGYFCLSVAKKHNVPIRIAHSHSNAMTVDFKRFIKLIMQKLYVLNATELFACSEEAGKYLFKKRPFKVLTNAIDSDRFAASDSKRSSIREELNVTDKFVVGHVGRFRPEKNHSFIIDVFDEIRKIKPNAVLVLVGSGDLENEIHNKVERLQLKDFVLFLGNRRDMDNIYQAMDICIFPSLYEGLGIVAIEAQAAGIPIVCSDRLPYESNVSPLYRKMPLEYSAPKWAYECIHMSEHYLSHTNMKRYIIKAGFDMETKALEMQEHYLNCLN